MRADYVPDHNGKCADCERPALVAMSDGGPRVYLCQEHFDQRLREVAARIKGMLEATRRAWLP